MPHGYRDLSLFVQDDWRLTDRMTIKAGLRYQNQYWRTSNIASRAIRIRMSSRPTTTTSRRGSPCRSVRRRAHAVHAAYGIYYDNHITGMAGIARGINGEDKVQTLPLQFPNSLAGGTRRAIACRAAAPAVFPSVEISIDRG